jgi:hypothetical protein
MWPAEIRILPGRPRRARVTKAAPKRTQALAGWAEVIAIQRWRLTGPRTGPVAIAGVSRSLGPTHGYAVSAAEGILFAHQGDPQCEYPFRRHPSPSSLSKSSSIGLAASRPPVIQWLFHRHRSLQLHDPRSLGLEVPTLLARWLVMDDGFLVLRKQAPQLNVVNVQAHRGAAARHRPRRGGDRVRSVHPRSDRHPIGP